MKKNLIFFLSLILFSANGFCIGVDFNANGVTDFVLYGKRSDGVKKYDHGFFLDNATTSSLTYGEYNKDKMIFGDFNGDNITDVGFVRVNKKSNIMWRFKNYATKKDSKAKEFGKAGDVILYGCDFNGNGKKDIAYIDGKKLYYKDFGGKEKIIKLPRSKYTYVYCADVTGDGKDEFIGKKKGAGYLNGAKKSDVWGHDVVSATKSKVLAKQIYFADPNVDCTRQKDIIALDVNSDGKKEMGFVKSDSQISWLVFSNDLNGTSTTSFYLPRGIKTINGNLQIYAGNFLRGPGVVYKGDDNNTYSYIVPANVDTTYILPRSVPDNIKNGELGRGIGFYTVKEDNSSQGGGSSGGSTGKVSCDVQMSVGNGFLWKGRGSSYGGVSVAILPLRKHASTCTIVAGDNSKTDPMWRSAYAANPINGIGREHWRAKSLCSAFKKPSVLRCNIGNKWHCWNLANPCTARIE